MPGEGSVFRRKSDGLWVAAISQGPRGNRVIHRRYAHSKTEARIALGNLLDELAARVMTDGTAVGVYLERWVSEARNIRESTRHGYSAVVTAHLSPTIGYIRLSDLTPLHVEAMLTELGPRMSAKTLRNTHVILRRALGQAVRAGLVTKNVASREFVDAPRVVTVDPVSLSHAEAHRFLDACHGDRLEALFVMALGTGLRQGELLGLAWQDVSTDGVISANVNVRHELVRRDGGYHLDDPKTERSKRAVPLSPSVRAALATHRERVKAAGFVPVASGPVFTNLSGAELSGSWLTHHFYDLLASAGVQRVPFKNLRTTFASRLAEANVSDRVIADLMGHTRTATTNRHYISTTASSAVDAIERLVG